MAKIITTSQLQKTIGQLLSYVSDSWLVITNKGKPAAVVLPYFDDNEDAIDDYLEAYEIRKNKKALEAYLKKSRESGLSDLRI